MAALADLATRRPLALLGGAIAILAVLVVLAVGTPDRLAVGSARIDQPAGPGLVVVARGRFAASSSVYRVAMRTILAGLRSGSAVASARETATRGRLSEVQVTLAPTDEAAREPRSSGSRPRSTRARSRWRSVARPGCCSTPAIRSPTSSGSSSCSSSRSSP